MKNTIRHEANNANHTPLVWEKSMPAKDSKAETTRNSRVLKEKKILFGISSSIREVAHAKARIPA
jgi:hypothetical protein